MKSSVKHVELLDHLRGVAILAVLVFHTLGMAFGYDALPWKGWGRDFSGQATFLCFLPLGMCAQAGVAIFFVVSGFCIHLSFQQQGQRWSGFFLRRFFRIYPAYLLALAFSLLILATNPGLDFFSREFWTQLLSHVFLVHNFDPATIYGANAALWSLAVEAQLYLLYPVLVLLVGRIGWLRVMGVLAGGELLIRGLDGWTQTVGASNAVAGQVSWLLANSPLGYWFSWALGAFIADAWSKQQRMPFLKISPLLWLGLAFASYFAKPLCVLQFPLFALATAAILARGLKGSFHDDIEMATKRPVGARGLPAKHGTSAGRVPSRNGWPAGIPAFSLGLLKHIGWWSYSLYLLHQPLLHVYSHLIVWAVPAENRPPPVAYLLLMVTWLAIIPFSFLWYKIIEVPGIALGKKIIGKLGDSGANNLLSASSLPLPRGGESGKSASSRRRLQGGAGAFRFGYGLMFAVLVMAVAATLSVSNRFSFRTAVKHADLAWLLATSPDAAQRDGVLAVKLAEDACLQTQYRQPGMVETLAAAYAEAGRFEEAIGAAQLACTLASQSGDQNLLQQYQAMQQRYVQHEPYHQSAAGGQ